MFDASLIKMGDRLDVKVYDDTVVHHFDIHDKQVDYIVTKKCSEPIARSTAEVIDIMDIDNHIRSLILRTQVYNFEIVQDSNYSFKAYRTTRH